MNYNGAHVNKKEYQEEQEILMIPIPQTIVHKVAVMVILLNAPVAEVAMSSVFRPQILTVDTHVIQIEFFIQKSFK